MCWLSFTKINLRVSCENELRFLTIILRSLPQILKTCMWTVKVMNVEHLHLHVLPFHYIVLCTHCMQLVCCTFNNFEIYYNILFFCHSIYMYLFCFFLVFSCDSVRSKTSTGQGEKTARDGSSQRVPRQVSATRGQKSAKSSGSSSSSSQLTSNWSSV